ncbi:gamma-mobile-trio protein GmtX [Roseateles sp.]|uniref:gamma-mobile-trio protein GmtX n=1 Tax=Roseateles sp. TaxID=1971397 RepID=UPI003BA7FB04
MTGKMTPDEVLDSIMATSPRPQKVRNLKELHSVCKALYEIGPRDFSYSHVGKVCESKSIMKARGLYNSAAEDYRKLIDAWAHLAGPLPPKLIDKNNPSQEYVSEIQDPVLRMLVKRDLAKLGRVTAELNLLKSQKTFVVDKRPIADSTLPMPTNAINQLEDSELKALRKALSPESLKRKGWEVTKVGEVVSDRGRTIFEPGFATGLRKLLGEQ